MRAREQLRRTRGVGSCWEEGEGGGGKARGRVSKVVLVLLGWGEGLFGGERKGGYG